MSLPHSALRGAHLLHRGARRGGGQPGALRRRALRAAAASDPAATSAALYQATRGEGFGPEVQRRILVGTYVLSAGYYDAYYRKAQRVRALIADDFRRAFAGGVDLLLTPDHADARVQAGEKTGDPVAMYLADIFVCADQPGRAAGHEPPRRPERGAAGRRAAHRAVLRGGADARRRAALERVVDRRRGGALMTWETVIGLEVHVQLRTRTKMFCGCRTTFGDPPNTNVCPVCLGLPGRAARCPTPRRSGSAPRGALALGCTVHATSVFARKNYFYPDLPKGYQISQFDQPLATGGARGVRLAGAGPDRDRHHPAPRRGGCRQARCTTGFPGKTAVDLNRAGTPLAEIVSEPDIRSPAEARAYLTHAPADAGVRRRERVQHGEGQPPGGREHLDPPPRRPQARHQDRGEEHEQLRQRRAGARGGARPADRAGRSGRAGRRR